MKIGLQLYSVRDVLAQDFEGTIRAVKAMGYDGVEFAGLDGHDPLEVKALLDELGLEVMSSHVPVDEMLTPGALEGYKTLGCDYVAIPWMQHGENGSEFPQNLEIIKKLAALVKEKGMTLLYHNHDFEFRTVNGKYILDTIYDEIPADLIKTEIDTCWVLFSDIDPAAYVRKYTGRAPIVHLKDFHKSPDNHTPPYDLIGFDDDGEKVENDFEFRPVGHGLQNMPEVVAAAKDAGADWVIVEQDESVGRTTLEAAKMSIDYLRSIGL